MGIDSGYLDPVDAERLLAGAATGAAPPDESASADVAAEAAHGRLAALLALASAPPEANELAGEDAAVATFRAARLASDSAPDRRVVRGRLRRVPVLAKAVAVAVVFTVGAGGAALASSAGDLGVVALRHHAPAGHDPRSSTSHVAGGPTSAQRPGAATGTPSSPVPGSPSASLRGLCHAYLAKAAAHPSAAPDPAFARLVAAAGRPADVAPYCRSLLASERKGSGLGRSQRPHPPGKPAIDSAG